LERNVSRRTAATSFRACAPPWRDMYEMSFLIVAAAINRFSAF
jgi:hypothetical protein